jgi:hypothetical protein
MEVPEALQGSYFGVEQRRVNALQEAEPEAEPAVEDDVLHTQACSPTPVNIGICLDALVLSPDGRPKSVPEGAMEAPEALQVSCSGVEQLRVKAWNEAEEWAIRAPETDDHAPPSLSVTHALFPDDCIGFGCRKR